MECNICSKQLKFDSEEELETHIAADHFNCFPYWCALCQYTRLPTEFALRRHYEKMHELTEYTIQYHFTPEIFRKKQSIKKALQEALDKKASKRHPSVSDLEQKGSPCLGLSPSLPPVEVILLDEDTKQCSTNSSQQLTPSSSNKRWGNQWLNQGVSSFEDVEQPSTSTALALNRCDQVINDEQMKKVQDTVEQFCAQTLRLKDDNTNDERFSMSLNDFISPDLNMSNQANVFSSGGIDFGMGIPKQSRLKQSVFQKGVSYKCLKCGACVTGPCIIMHINMRHLKLPCFRCKACDKRSLHTSSTSMVQHIRQAHNGDMSLIENNYKEVSREVRKARPLFFEIYRI